jgi:hypothetical protein
MLMAEVTTYMAKQPNKLDCGCLARPGEQPVHVVKIFVCEQTLTPLLRLLIALHPKSQPKPAEQA